MMTHSDWQVTAADTNGPEGLRLRFVMTGAQAVVLLAAAPALGYLGPGGAVSGLGTLLGVLAAITMAIFGFLWFPIKRLLRRRRPAPTANASTGGTIASPGEESAAK